jgi:hypothetical protein
MSGALAALAIIALGGCSGSSDSLPRTAVSGTVKFEGAPLAQGSIQFLPNTPEGVGAGAVVTAGKFEVPKENGLVPGSYSVVINSSLADSTPADPTAPVSPKAAAKELIPEQYNSKSRLNAEVKAEGPNQLEFDLKK